jgi:competence protein ComEA
MAATPQEKLALGVAALLLAAGAAARAFMPGPDAPELSGAPGVEATASTLIGQVADSVEKEKRRDTPLAPGEKIDPSTAPVDELIRLPQVGPGLAQRIVDWRESHGPFRTMADLDSVPGVGPAVLREAGPHLALRPAQSPSSTRRSFQPAASVADWDRSPEKKRPGAAPSGRVVDINTATAAELASLPGIGEVKARRIVEHRGAHGPFSAVDSLAQVSGIGRATVERLRPHVRATP